MKSLVFFGSLFSVCSVLAVAFVAPLINLIFVEDHTLSEFKIFPGDRFQALVVMCVTIGAAFLAKNLTYLLAISARNRLQTRWSTRMRNDLIDRVLQQSYTYFLGVESGVLSSKIVQTVQRIAEHRARVVFDLARVVPLILGHLTILLWLNWVLVILLLVLVPALAMLNHAAGNVAKRMAVDEETEGGRLQQAIQQSLRHVKLIKLFNIEGHRAMQLDRAGRRWLDRLRLRALREAWFLGGLEMGGVLIGNALLFLIGQQTMDGHFRYGPGGFVLFIAAAFSLIDPIKDLMKAFGLRQENRRLNELITTVGRTEHRPVVDHPRFENVLQFHEVSYRFPGSPTAVLSDVSCSIRPGDHIALVGPSGAGKSTWGNLLTGLLDPTSGSVLIDGVPTSQLDGPSRAAIFGVIDQDVTVFRDTLRNNLTMGSSIADGAIVEALEQAGLVEWFREQPAGLETVLGEDGRTLSGGERQRLAIARLLLRNPQIIFLDEPTSGLDLQTENFVLSRLFSSFRDRTIIAVSHRTTVVEYVRDTWVLEKTGIMRPGLSFPVDLPIVHKMGKE